MTTDTNVLNREKLALKQLEMILNEISCLCDEDPSYNSYIASLCAFSRSIDDITAELRQLNRFN